LRISVIRHSRSGFGFLVMVDRCGQDARFLAQHHKFAGMAHDRFAVGGPGDHQIGRASHRFLMCLSSAPTSTE